jgi:hypothetical protein
LVLARIMDDPRALSSQPPAAKALAALLDKVRPVSALVVAPAGIGAGR